MKCIANNTNAVYATVGILDSKHQLKWPSVILHFISLIIIPISSTVELVSIVSFQVHVLKYGWVEQNMPIIKIHSLDRCFK